MTSGSGPLAVVVGAGVGGLTAAAALSHHFPQVIVLERDALSRETLLRQGVPQGHHVHGLLAGGGRAGCAGSVAATTGADKRQLGGVTYLDGRFQVASSQRWPSYETARVIRRIRSVGKLMDAFERMAASLIISASGSSADMLAACTACRLAAAAPGTKRQQPRAT
jgi:2-polyprenyl-6-methoxyphenol hydroxylase-like FAD-dependent oxidoreductase